MEHLHPQLEAIDRELCQTPAGDLDALQRIIEKRAAVIQQTVALLDHLRAEDRDEFRSALRQSLHAGQNGLRQLILAKHMLATELGELKREQRLAANLASQGESPSSLGLNIRC